MAFDLKTIGIIATCITTFGTGGGYAYVKIQDYADLKAKQKYSEEIIKNYDTLLSANLHYKFTCDCR